MCPTPANIKWPCTEWTETSASGTRACCGGPYSQQVLLCIEQHVDVSLSWPQRIQLWIGCWREVGRYCRELPLHLYKVLSQKHAKFFGKIVCWLKIAITGQLSLA